MGSIVLVDGAGKTITAATTDGSGRYDITAPNGIYTITISGPQGSNITPTTLKDQVLSNDSQRDFALSTPQPAKAIKSTIPYAAIAVVVLVIVTSVGIFLFLKRRKPTLV